MWKHVPAPMGLEGNGKPEGFVCRAASLIHPFWSPGRFYFASEVSSTGGPVRSPDPASHAEVFYELVKQQEQGDWDVRFAKGSTKFKV